MPSQRPIGPADHRRAELERMLQRYLELRADEAALREILDAGADRARAVSSQTLSEMRRRMGFGG